MCVKRSFAGYLDASCADKRLRQEGGEAGGRTFSRQRRRRRQPSLPCSSDPAMTSSAFHRFVDSKHLLLFQQNLRTEIRFTTLGGGRARLKRRRVSAQACGKRARGRARESPQILLLSQKSEIIHVLFSGGFFARRLCLNPAVEDRGEASSVFIYCPVYYGLSDLPG